MEEKFERTSFLFECYNDFTMLFHIVINPVGASGGTMKVWHKVEPLFQSAHIDYVVHTSTIEDGIENICHRLTDTLEKTYIVIIGGDGTLNEAVNGIVNFKNTMLGFIPCGSGNDLARALHISKNVKEVFESLKDGTIKHICDVGEITFHNSVDEYRGKLPSHIRRFNVSAGIGFDAEICQKVHVSKMKKVLNKIHLGKLSYIFEAVKVIFGAPMIPFDITLDGDMKKYTKCLFAVGMNHAYEGGGFKFCPNAKENDELIDICLADHLTRFDFFKIFPYAYNGNHVKFKGVHTFKAKTIKIDTEKPLWVHTDGEVYCRSSSISMRLLDEKLNMIV